ncbi:DUF4143 domain-containing protein [Glycomyces sp. NPDC049804]|uniref:ATP-binding protein n=1 Tax=Glycomyces sp. NPDC049804 TaxID=3154363 RepID=UPI0034380AA0
MITRTPAFCALHLLEGARQTGKTTLARELLALPDDAWFSLDNEAILYEAVNDPVGFVSTLPVPAAIDEVQRAGQGLILAIKMAADRRSDRGQLLLTGSANYLAARGVSETLAGRVGRIALWPLSIGERRSVRETFVDSLFNPDAWPPRVEPISRAEIADLILEGGFPEVVTSRLTGRNRRDWFEAYTHDVISREELRPIAQIRSEENLRMLFRLMAARTASEVQISDIASDAQQQRSTVVKHLALLEALHLVVTIPAWSTNITSSVKQRPKSVLVDTGLAADLCGAGEKTFTPNGNPALAGALFESLVITEVLKQTVWSEHSVDVRHYRDRNGGEIDLIVEERRTGEIAGIEVKLSSTPNRKHAKHLMWLRDKLGDRFKLGLVIYGGDNALSLGDRIWAVPVSALWRSD